MSQVRRGPYRDALSGLEAVYLGQYWEQAMTSWPSLDDCLVEHDIERPWLLTVWEPILTKAPAPPKAQPFCCYSNTIIFYHSPYIKRAATNIWHDDVHYRIGSKGQFEKWDQLETRLRRDDVVRFGGDEFDIHGGQVVWARRRWWMHRNARRRQPR